MHTVWTSEVINGWQMELDKSWFTPLSILHAMEHNVHGEEHLSPLAGAFTALIRFTLSWTLCQALVPKLLPHCSHLSNLSHMHVAHLSVSKVTIQGKNYHKVSQWGVSQNSVSSCHGFSETLLKGWLFLKIFPHLAYWWWCRTALSNTSLQNL